MLGSRPKGGLESAGGSNAPSARRACRHIGCVGVSDGVPGGSSTGRLAIRLRRLEERICELLIKNHQLRMALMESKAMVPEDDDGRNV
jgi:hypothetical protein